MNERKKKPAGSDRSQTVRDIPRACADETAAVEFIERKRWPDGPACPDCGSVAVYAMKNRDGSRSSRFLWRCREKECHRQFTVRIGTVFEDSRVPLRFWILAFYRLNSSKKGYSALQLKRETGLTYKSAWFLLHRVRYAMADGPGAPPPLDGTVEVDETFVGGKPRNRPRNADEHRAHLAKKAPVVVLVERGGKARVRVISKVNAKNLRAMMLDGIAPTAHLMTDDATWYPHAKHDFASHETTKHSHGEYARGDVYSNTAESFFAILKRGVYGTYHSVSKRHLHRYCAEFQHRWNLRETDDGERTVEAIRKAWGKRLLYRQPTTSDGRATA
jgi:transposase-like protein